MLRVLARRSDRGYSSSKTALFFQNTRRLWSSVAPVGLFVTSLGGWFGHEFTMNYSGAAASDELD